MTKRASHGFEYDDYPYISGQGALHDPSPDEGSEPRLAFARSVSRAAMHALNHKPEPVRRPMGFRLPSHR